ncbi:MAG: AAA family ATPase, partial [Rhizobiales bacterium]|nr:AAA family ATPase [Rhizobacter sp.]
MYAPFFGLKHEPFSIAPDPRYLFMSERHREALAHLLYGVNGGGGFVLLSGEIGAGKTTVCRCFLEQIPRRTNVAYIFNPKLTVIELLQSVCEEFGIPPPQRAHDEPTVKDYLDPLNEFLLKTHAVGQNNVLIIDEAQMLSADVLEQLRLLTNLETSERKLLQIILIGQPELRDLLARPELEQLAQRVIARYHLGALNPDETERYIRHRLSVAGMTIAMPFDAKAIERIHQLSRGVPRRINLLADRALLGAYSVGKGQVDRAIVDKAAGEVFDREHSGTPRRWRADRRSLLSNAALAGAVIAAVALLLYSLPRSAVLPADVAASAAGP